LTINIISTQVNRTRITGPKKVLDNTLKGLDKIGVTYVFNKSINEYKYNWIHDDQKAIIEAGFVGKPVLIGPNTAVLPKDLPKLRKRLPKGSVYIHPSKWSADVWRQIGYGEAKLDFWPAGIDMDEFKIVDKKDNKKVLFYFKERDLKLIDKVKKILKRMNLEYEIIHYGFYQQNDYKKTLKNSKFGIWIGRQESQGIGLQEALATGLPLVVLDATSLFDTVPTDSKNYYAYEFPQELRSVKTSTAPYFDERCGIKIENIDKLEDSIKYIQENIHSFNPREYIEENLSLEKSAKGLVSFFERMDIEDKKSYNYQKISKVLFYIGLVFQKWAWKRAFRKLKMEN